MRIHLNYAGAGIPSPAVDRAVRDYLDLERRLGPYEAEAHAGEAVVAGARDAVGRLLGVPAAAVAFFDNATRAWGTLVTNLAFRPGDVAWVSPYDYVGNLAVLATLRRTAGLTLVPMPLTPAGDLDLDWVDRNLTGDVALVSATHVPSCAGVVSDVDALGARLRGHRALYVVDGCQAVGNVPVDVARIACDVYTGAGRKFLAGPRGTGFAAVSARYLAAAAPAVLDVQAVRVSPALELEAKLRTAADLELAERAIAGWAGLRVAVEEHLAAGPAVAAQRAALLARVEDRVGDRRLGGGSVRSGICSVRLPDPAGAYERLRERGISAWVGTGAHTPLFAPGAGAAEFLRLSVGDRTTDAEVDRLLVALDAVLARASLGRHRSVGRE